MQFKNKSYKAVLFDFDGVIANTMHDNFIAWQTVMSDFGIEINEQDYFQREGLKPKDVATYFLTPHKLDTPYNIKKAVEEKEAAYIKINNFSLYPEVEELINELSHQKIKMAIVTGSSKTRLISSVSQINDGHFIEFFDHIITAADYQSGKPNPEPYLVAVEKLSVNVKECLVIENAPLGITSARRANIDVVAVSTTLEKKYLSDADDVFESISHLYKDIFGVK